MFGNVENNTYFARSYLKSRPIAAVASWHIMDM